MSLLLPPAMPTHRASLIAAWAMGALLGRVHAAPPYSIVDTGQAKCYDHRKEIAPPKPGQPFYGQDAQFQAHPPSYTLSADGLHRRHGDAPVGFVLAFRPAPRYQAGMKLQVPWMVLTCVVGLLVAGCGPSAPRTPLHAAVQDGNYPAVRQHIAAGSDLNAKNSAGWTALHLAAMKGDRAMVELLAGAGADAARTGPEGKTPVDAAREKGQTSIVQYLEARLKAGPEKVGQEKRGRGLIDGGVGVSEVLDAN